ncbi:MAG: hypothetical protein DHS20C12_30100 [Pseudohongiella sp.]|nr:MAG: hypothetical protein DHS20C12_30100 [Pseudohongiella sp.]
MTTSTNSDRAWHHQLASLTLFPLLALISQLAVAQMIIVGADGFVTAQLGANDDQLLRMIAPEYPLRAKQRDIAGYNLVSFSVDVNGEVEADSITIVDSEPSEVFDSASMSAIAEFKFRPTSVNGARSRVEGLRYVIRYTLERPRSAFLPTSPQNRDYLPLNYITPEYPPVARQENIEGYVLVEFTVTQQGVPRGIVILDRSPSDIFNASAVSAAERFRFEPRVMDGETVEAEGAQYLFSYELED